MDIRSNLISISHDDAGGGSGNRLGLLERPGGAEGLPQSGRQDGPRGQEPGRRARVRGGGRWYNHRPKVNRPEFNIPLYKTETWFISDKYI